MSANPGPSPAAAAVLRQGGYQPLHHGQFASRGQAAGNSHDFERSVQACRNVVAGKKAAQLSRSGGKNLPPGKSTHPAKALRHKHVGNPSSPGASAVAVLHQASVRPCNERVGPGKSEAADGHLAPKTQKSPYLVQSGGAPLEQGPEVPGVKARLMPPASRNATSPVSPAEGAAQEQSGLTLVANLSKTLAARTAREGDIATSTVVHSARGAQTSREKALEALSAAGRGVRPAMSEPERMPAGPSASQVLRSLETVYVMQEARPAGPVHAKGSVAVQKASDVRKNPVGSDSAGQSSPLFGASGLPQQIFTVRPESAVLPPAGSTLPPHELSAQLGQHMVMMLAQGKHDALLQLSPPQLGTIHVHLSTDQHAVNALFVSAHPDVRHALEASMPSLQHALAQQGLSLAGSFVADHGREGFSGRQPGSYPSAARTISASLRELDPLSGQSPDLARAARYLSRGVSIYV